MTTLRWSDGPKQRGCVYHKRGTCRFLDDSIVVDVFVMPRIVKARPIAITIGRYRDCKPVAPKEQRQLRSLDRIAGANVEVSSALQRLGVPLDMAISLGCEVEGLLSRETEGLRGVLAPLSVL